MVAYGLEHDNDNVNTVQVARSADHGASFRHGIADRTDGSFPYPVIKIGPFGTAHLVYAKGRNPGAAILCRYSFPPYRTWSAEAVRLDDDVPQADVGAPPIAVGACGPSAVLHAAWLDSSSQSVRYTRKVAQPGYAWSEPLEVGHLTVTFLDSLAAAGPRAFSVFSGVTTADPQKWGVAGSRISSGVTCP